MGKQHTLVIGALTQKCDEMGRMLQQEQEGRQLVVERLEHEWQSKVRLLEDKMR